MKYVTKSKFDNEFCKKGEKHKVYYNPDNSVAIFEEADSKLWDYVLEKGFKLKESGFYMNKENEEKIRDFLKEEQPIEPKGKLVATEGEISIRGRLTKKRYQEVMEELDSKPTVASLTKLVKEIFALLS